MPITPDLADKAKGDIIDFVRQVHDVLDSVIREPHGVEGLLVLEEMLKPLKDAWAEFKEDFDFEAAKEQIDKVSAQLLQDHGLYGAQSEGKRRLFEVRLEIFKSQRTKRALLWLLDAIDTYLDSIIKATRLSEALKEIKDILRNSIDD